MALVSYFRALFSAVRPRHWVRPGTQARNQLPAQGLHDLTPRRADGKRNPAEGNPFLVL